MTGPEKTIFVRIPAYRDPECVPTLRDLFGQARHPERIRVGVCWQYGPEEQPLEVPASFADRVRVCDVPAAESRGAGWAKAQADALWRGEDFVLFVDAHTRFAPDWDVKLLAEWAACETPRAVLSAPPAGYRPPDERRARPTPGYRRPHRIEPNGLPVFRTSFFEGRLDAPVRVAFVVGRFIFAPAAMLSEVPTDPFGYQDEEEATLSLRLFTHGWAVYAPADVHLWHLYNDDGHRRPLHWTDVPDWRRLREVSKQRACSLLGLEAKKAHEVVDSLAPYGLGDQSSVDDFTAFSGLDLARGQSSPRADDCPFLVGLRSVASVDTYWIRPVSNEPPTPLSTPLVVGDFSPYIMLPRARGGMGALQLYAGAPTALFFVGIESDGDALFAALAAHQSQWETLGLRAIIVTGGDPAHLETARAAQGARAGLWLDAEGAAATTFCGNGPKECAFLLDRNLRIEAVIQGDASVAVERFTSTASTCMIEGIGRTLESHPPVLLVADVLGPELRADLLALWTEGDQFQGRTGSGAGSKVRPGRKVRTDVQVPAEIQRRLDAALMGRLLPEIEKVFGLRATRREAYKIGCYPAENGGFFSQHRDNFEPALVHRRFALTLNLNADFEGGHLVFPEYGPDGYRPPAGTGIVFPCALMHRVNPVTAGERFTLVSFFYGEDDARFRRQVRAIEQLPPPTDDRRFTVPRRGVVTHHEDVRHRYPLTQTDAPLRPITLVDARGHAQPETARIRTDVPDGLLVIDGYLHPDACRRVTEYALAAPGTPLKVMDNSRSTADAVKTMASDKRVTERVKIDGLSTELLSLFLDIYGHRLEPHYGVEFEWFERPQILRYPRGGVYEAHADAEHWDRTKKSFVRAQDRDYSVLVYVNDDYEGGAVDFTRLGFRLQPASGMLVAFPSDHRYEHAARPTTAGTRVALVSWAAVKGTPRVRKKHPYGAVILRPR